MSKTNQRKKSHEKLGFEEGRKNMPPRFQKTFGSRDYYRGYRRGQKHYAAAEKKKRDTPVIEGYDDL